MNSTSTNERATSPGQVPSGRAAVSEMPPECTRSSAGPPLAGVRAIADVTPAAAPAGADVAPLERSPDSRRRPAMVDLFSGSGSASRAAAVRGWHVTRIDNGLGTAADFKLDIRNFAEVAYVLDSVRADVGGIDLLWASPPCTLLSTANQKTRNVSEGLDCVLAAVRIIEHVKPRWWVLENVHGATRAIGELLGPPVERYGSFYLWGVFPPFAAVVPRDKTKKSGRRRAERRAAIPWAISNGLVLACEELARELSRK